MKDMFLFKTLFNRKNKKEAIRINPYKSFIGFRLFNIWKHIQILLDDYSRYVLVIFTKNKK